MWHRIYAAHAGSNGNDHDGHEKQCSRESEAANADRPPALAKRLDCVVFGDAFRATGETLGIASSQAKAALESPESRRLRHGQPKFWAVTGVVLALLGGQGSWAQTQSTLVVKASGFTANGYHPGPITPG
jgi:hypothetical protein